MKKQHKVLFDACVLIAAVENIPSKRSPSSWATLPIDGPGYTPATGVLRAFALVAPMPVVFGEHHRRNIVAALVRKGWAWGEADAWANVCEAHCVRTGTDVVAEVTRDLGLDRKVAAWGVEDREDAQMAEVARRGGATVLVTSDRRFADCKVDGLNILSTERFAAGLAELIRRADAARAAKNTRAVPAAA